MSKRESDNFVVTFPLQTELWQEDILHNRFKLLKSIYNNLTRKMCRVYHNITLRKDFAEVEHMTKMQKKDYFEKVACSKTYIRKQKDKDGNEVETQVFPMTKYGHNHYALLFLKNYSKYGINSSILEDVGSSVWKAREKFLYGNGKKIHIKRDEDDTVNSYAVRFKTGGYFTGFDTSQLLTKHIIGINLNCGQGKNAKMIYIPFKVDRKSLYEAFAFQNQLRKIGIKRVMVRGKWRFFLSLTFEGHPYSKGREIGKGDVGIDIGPSSIAVCSDNEVSIDELASNVENIDKKLWRIQRKMDRSRRQTNPDRFNEDGTVKKGVKGKWVKSKRYLRLQAEYRELHRKRTLAVKLSHAERANNMLSMGDRFVVENNNFSAMQRRAKETKTNAKGKFCKKKRFGKSLLTHSPAAFITILGNKVNYLGGKLIKVECSNAASQFDFTNGTFTKHKLGERRITLSNGNTHQRDILAAFNLQHLKNVTKDESGKYVTNYKVSTMKKKYDRFVEMEREVIDRCKATVPRTRRLASFGF